MILFIMWVGGFKKVKICLSNTRLKGFSPWAPIEAFGLGNEYRILEILENFENFEIFEIAKAKQYQG